MAKMNYQQCNRCVMDNASDKSIIFDKNGYCNYCTDTLRRLPSEYFPNEIGRKKLDEMMATIKAYGKDKKYDCIVGVSGGIDSSYIIYLGYKYGLRMLAVHIDDGFDTDIAVRNIQNLCKKANVELININPDPEEFADLTLSFLKASLPNIAIPQDNVLFKALFDLVKRQHIKYSLIGDNFSTECILERGEKVNASDGKHIRMIHKKYGTIPLRKIRLQSLFETYIMRRYFSSVIKVSPLNYIDYQLEHVLNELHEFSDYQYYGGKHYENILTRFLQCYYLPVKFGFDKRKSHLSSMIVSRQLKREDAVKLLSQSDYVESGLFQSDMEYICQKLHLLQDELMEIIALPPKSHSEYPHSVFNKFSKLARKFRKYLG